jgi:hypothetical protein
MLITFYCVRLLHVENRLEDVELDQCKLANRSPSFSGLCRGCGRVSIDTTAAVEGKVKHLCVTK